MRIIIYFLVLLITIPALGQQHTGADTSRSFTQVVRKNYSISSPKGWEVDTSGKLGADIFLYSPATSAADSFRENVNVWIQDLTGHDYDVTRMGNESEKQLADMLSNFKVLERRLDSNATNPSYILRFTSDHGKFRLYMEQRYFLKNDIGYAVTLALEQGKEKEFLEMSSKIFTSFVLH